MTKKQVKQPEPETIEPVATEPVVSVPPPDIAEILKGMQAADIDALELMARAAIARERDDAEGFGHFFWCIMGKELAPYARKTWVPEIYAAKAENTGLLNEAFRGSSKSTVGMVLDVFITGHNPKGSGLIVGANDDTANKMSALEAAIIEFLPTWKAVFPNVVPDKARGWGAQGYFVKDQSIEYGKWVEMTVQDHMKDPSFVGAGVSSSDIPGMHPSNFLHIDDIHDRKNTSSVRDMESVKEDVKKNILPTMSRPGPKPFYHVEFTPWKKDDAYQMMVDIGLFRHIKTPLYTEVEEGTPGSVIYDEKCVLFEYWPGFIGPEFADLWRKILVDRETFHLMMLLDREGALKERIFKYYPYRNELVMWGWPLVDGADYASVYKPSAGNPGGRSHFALAHVLKSPEGVAVVAGGVIKQCTQLEAEEYALRSQRVFTGYLNTVCEMNGKGEEFYQLLARHPEMRLIPKWTGISHKADRLWKNMSSWFELGKVRVSDDPESEFLRLLRSFLDKFPNLDIHAPEWDVADSVYYALLGMPDILIMPKAQNEIPMYGRKKSNNPFLFGRLQ